MRYEVLTGGKEPSPLANLIWKCYGLSFWPISDDDYTFSTSMFAETSLSYYVVDVFISNLASLFQVSEAIFVINAAIRDVCGKPPTERLFLDKYGKICLCLDEIVWKVRERTNIVLSFCIFLLGARDFRLCSMNTNPRVKYIYQVSRDIS